MAVSAAASSAPPGRMFQQMPTCRRFIGKQGLIPGRRDWNDHEDSKKEGTPVHIRRP